MPTIFILLGYRFYFYANDHLPIHIHIEKGDGKAVFQIEPEVKLLKSENMKTKELALAEAIAEERKEEIIAKWNEFFNTKNEEK